MIGKYSGHFNFQLDLFIFVFLCEKESLKWFILHFLGEYLGSIQSQFNMQVLNCFAQEMDFGGMHIDIGKKHALKKYDHFSSKY